MGKDKGFRPEIYDQARTYAYGAAMEINSERAEDPNFQNFLDEVIKKAKNNDDFQQLSFIELAVFTANYTRDKITNNRGDINDLDLVGMEIGLLSYIWRNSLPVCNKKFDEIFIASWQIFLTT